MSTKKMPFGASNILSTLGKRTRAAASNNDKSEDSESSTQSSSSDNDDDNKATTEEVDIRTALDAINELRQNDEAAMGTILEAVLEQRKKLDALQRLVHEELDALQMLVLETGKQRRNNLNKLHEVVIGLERWPMIIARGRSSRDNKRRRAARCLRSPLEGEGGIVSPSRMDRNPFVSTSVVPMGFRLGQIAGKTSDERTFNFEEEEEDRRDYDDAYGEDRNEVEMADGENKAQDEEVVHESEQEKEKAKDKGKGKEKQLEQEQEIEAGLEPGREQQEKRQEDGKGDDAMDLDAAAITIEDDSTTSAHTSVDSPMMAPASRKNRARRTKPSKEMFAPTAAASALSPSPQMVRRAMGLRGQAPLKYYKPIPLPGDEEDFNPATLFREESVSSSYAPSQPSFGRSHSVKSPTLKLTGGADTSATAGPSAPRTPLKKLRFEGFTSVHKAGATSKEGGDNNDAMMTTPSNNRTVIDPHALTPSQTREHNANALSKALNRHRMKSNNATLTKTPLKQQTIPFFATVNRAPKAGESSGIGIGSSSKSSSNSNGEQNGNNKSTNNVKTAHTEDDTSPDIVQDLKTRFPSEIEPTYNTIPSRQKVFSRYHLATLIGGRKQDIFVKVRHKDCKNKYLAQIDQYLAFKTTKNPYLPSVAGDHGVAYVLQDMEHMHVNRNLTMPLFICENERNWKYLGGYEIHEAVDLGKPEWDSLLPTAKEYWVNTLSTTAWGIKYLKTNGVFDTTPENIWRLLEAPSNKMNIRLPRRVLKFVKYDKEFYELLVNGSEALELSLSRSPKDTLEAPAKGDQKGHQARSPLTISDSDDEMDDELL